MADHRNLLGTFLRAHRERVTPAQAGLAAHGVRRTPGLRREEVAMLAGISADYYLRLERGRDTRPSAQVLGALARVLRLDDVATAHLRRLAGAPAPELTATPADVVPAETHRLLAAIGQPAFVEDRFYDVRAANDLARALSPGLVPGANQLRDLFLSPAEQALHPDWHTITACWVAHLRQVVGPDVDDPRFVALTRDLAAGSPRFRELWARQDVKEQTSGEVRLQHPHAGALRLQRDRLAVSGTADLHLVVLHAVPGSDDERRLARLAERAGVLAGPRLTGVLARA